MIRQLLHGRELIVLPIVAAVFTVGTVIVVGWAVWTNDEGLAVLSAILVPAILAVDILLMVWWHDERDRSE